MGASNDDNWALIGSILSGLDPVKPSGLYGSLLGTTIPSDPKPKRPSATSVSQIRLAEERFEKRLQRLRDILPVKTGRVVPDDDDLMIGAARRLKLAVVFLDICGFSKIPSDDEGQQDNVLKVLNLFMAEMLQVVKKHGGVFEKNTGDGLMAYFSGPSECECAQLAVDAAVTMHCYNDQVISPRLKKIGLPEIRFRVGIEAGTVTVANVGIVGGDHRSLVAIGTTANVACKLMTLLPSGGIVIGDYTRSILPEEWKMETLALTPLPGFVLRNTTTPYPAWELKYRASGLVDWASVFAGLGGV